MSVSPYSLRVKQTPQLAPPERYANSKHAYRWINVANFIRGETMVEGQSLFFDPGAWVDTAHAKKVAAWYESVEVAGDKLPLDAVDYSLASSVWKQLGVISTHHRAGLLSYVHFSLVDNPEPYDSAESMFAHLDEGFLLVPSSNTLGGHPLWTNEQWEAFRATHSVVHWLWHLPFSLPGEDGAYRAHAAMVGEIFRPALAMETRVKAAAKSLDVWSGRKLVLPDTWVYRTNGPSSIDPLSGF